MGSRLTEAEIRTRVLHALSLQGDLYTDFATIAAEGELDIKLVRPAVRALAQDGLAVFARMTWDEDGRPSGAGYAITPAGRTALGQSEGGADGSSDGGRA